MRILSADWVLPVEGEPIENGAVAIEDGRIAAVGTAAELGEGERFPDAAIVPGFVNAHTHLEYAVYAGFGDGLSFAPWIAMHIERKARLDRADMEAIARLGAAECLRSGITTVGDLGVRGRRARMRAPRSGCAPSSIWRSSAATPRKRCASSTRSTRTSTERCRTSSAWACRRTPRTRARTTSTAPASSSACRSRRTCTRARTSSTGCSAAKGRGSRSPTCCRPRAVRPASAGSRRRACWTRRWSRHTASRSTRTRSRCWRSTASPSHIARGRTRCSAAGSRRCTRSGTPACVSASARTASRRCRRTTSSRSCGRCSRLRGRATSAPMRSPLPRRWSSQLSAAPGRSGSTTRSDRSPPASERISRSSRFSARRIYHGRIRPLPSSTAALRTVSLATLVDGKARYERGGFEWQELIDATYAARGRMLQRTVTSATATS